MIFILLMLRTMCIVISPLKSIMSCQKQQCDSMNVASVVLKPKPEMASSDIRGIQL